MNVTALLDTAGDAVERYSCDPYGSVTVYSDDWSTTVDWDDSKKNPVRYCGYFFDNETGLYCVRYRFYVPPLGRWLQRDPLGYVDGMGLYEYVGSAPTGLVDPTGTLFTKECTESGLKRDLSKLIDQDAQDLRVWVDMHSYMQQCGKPSDLGQWCTGFATYRITKRLWYRQGIRHFKPGKSYITDVWECWVRISKQCTCSDWVLFNVYDWTEPEIEVTKLRRFAFVHQTLGRRSDLENLEGIESVDEMFEEAREHIIHLDKELRKGIAPGASDVPAALVDPYGVAMKALASGLIEKQRWEHGIFPDRPIPTGGIQTTPVEIGEIMDQERRNSICLKYESLSGGQ